MATMVLESDGRPIDDDAVVRTPVAAPPMKTACVPAVTTWLAPTTALPGATPKLPAVVMTLPSRAAAAAAPSMAAAMPPPAVTTVVVVVGFS